MSIFTDALLLISIGLVAGTVGSLLGLGGGLIIVPALLWLASSQPMFSAVTPSVAVGTSLIMIILTALTSTIAYVKQKRVDLKSGFIFFYGSGPGVLLGSYLTKYYSSKFFLIAFGLLMIILSFVLTIKSTKPINLKWNVRGVYFDQDVRYEYGYPYWMAFTFSFIVGMISGLFGIGGGTLMIPMMVVLFKFPLYIATSTSMFTILLTSFVGGIIHTIQGNIHWFSALFLAPGAWIGGYLGAWISSRITSRTLLILLRGALIVVAVRMILSGLNLV